MNNFACSIKSMEIKDQILAENSKWNTDYVTQAIGDDRDKFMLVWHYVKNESPPLSTRAAWILENSCKRHPHFASTLLDQLIEILPEIKNHTIKRHLLKILSFSDLHEANLGRLFNDCLKLLESPKETVAAKAYSMQILFNISEIEPELKPELTIILETQMMESSSGIKARTKILLDKLNKQILNNS